MGADNVAPKGTIWVCGACGRTAYDKHNGPSGWDASCVLNAVLCHEQRGADGEWVAVAGAEDMWSGA